jgi:hypothetical protein
MNADIFAYDKIRSMVESRLATGWGTRTPIKFENVTFVQPTTGDWIAISTMFGQSTQISMGSPKFERIRCLVMVQIFTDKNCGQKTALLHAGFLRNIFQSQQIIFNGINVVFETLQLVHTGTRPDNYQLNVKVPFNADVQYDPGFDDTSEDLMTEAGSEDLMTEDGVEDLMASS